MLKTFVKMSITLWIVMAQSSAIHAQEVHGNPNVWYLLLANHHLTDQWNIGTELHMRYDDWMSDKEQFLFRPYVDFNTRKSPNVVYTFGYTYVKTFPYGDYPVAIDKPENNIWEQVTFKHQYGKLQVQHRYRLEQRWQRDIVYNPVDDTYSLNGNTFGNRFRYRLTLTQPLSDKVFINAFDELWIKGDKALRAITYDRNWLYVALGYHLTPDISFQLAYLHQYAINNPNLYERHHGLQVTGSITL